MFFEVVSEIKVARTLSLETSIWANWIHAGYNGAVVYFHG